MSSEEIQLKPTTNPLSLKNRLPFNSKTLMITLSILKFVGGIFDLIYALITLYYLNNLKIYSYGLASILGYNVTNANVTAIVRNISNYYEAGHISPSKNDDIDKYLYNYLVLSVFKIVSSFFSFAIRESFKNWRMDIGFFILYQTLSNIGGFGTLASWIYITNTKVMQTMVLLNGHKVFYILSVVFDSLNCIGLLIIHEMSKNNYFEIYPKYMKEDKKEDKLKNKNQ